VGGVVLPGLADVEEEGWVCGGEVLLELGDGDFEVHRVRVNQSCGGPVDSYWDGL